MENTNNPHRESSILPPNIPNQNIPNQGMPQNIPNQGMSPPTPKRSLLLSSTPQIIDLNNGYVNFSIDVNMKSNTGNSIYGKESTSNFYFCISTQEDIDSKGMETLEYKNSVNGAASFSMEVNKGQLGVNGNPINYVLLLKSQNSIQVDISINLRKLEYIPPVLPKKKNIMIYVVVGIVGVIAVGLVVYFMYIKKDKKKEVSSGGILKGDILKEDKDIKELSKSIEDKHMEKHTEDKSIEGKPRLVKRNFAEDYDRNYDKSYNNNYRRETRRYEDKRDNYREDKRDNYRDNNYREDKRDNYRDNNYRDNNYREDKYEREKRETSNKKPELKDKEMENEISNIEKSLGLNLDKETLPNTEVSHPSENKPEIAVEDTNTKSGPLENNNSENKAESNTKSENNNSTFSEPKKYRFKSILKNRKLL